jgi:phage shock protein B
MGSDIFWAVVILLVVIVLPLWIVLHYMTRWRAMRGLATEDEKMLTDLWNAVRRFEERMDNLERVLGSGDTGSGQPGRTS